MPPLVVSRLKMPHSRRSESGRLGGRQVARVAQPPEVLLDLHEARMLGSAHLAADDVERQAHGVGGRRIALVAVRTPQPAASLAPAGSVSVRDAPRVAPSGAPPAAGR